MTLDTLVKSSGDTMEGHLAFVTGLGDALILNQNDVSGVGNLSATTGTFDKL
jgi:hypothetical protein